MKKATLKAMNAAEIKVNELEKIWLALEAESLHTDDEKKADKLIHEAHIAEVACRTYYNDCVTKGLLK